jgi:hypothetical protein
MEQILNTENQRVNLNRDIVLYWLYLSAATKAKHPYFGVLCFVDITGRLRQCWNWIWQEFSSDDYLAARIKCC